MKICPAYSMRIRAAVALGLAAWLVLLAACVAGPKFANHAFGFDIRYENPGVEILAYRYGTSTMTNSDTNIKHGTRSHRAAG